MADLSIVPRRVPPGGPQNRALRLNRARSRGLMVDTRTGFSSRDRRNLMDRAVRSTLGLTVALIRKRLRYGWLLQDALATPAPTQ